MYVKKSAAHASIEEQFGRPACLQHYAMIHELEKTLLFRPSRDNTYQQHTITTETSDQQQ